MALGRDFSLNQVDCAMALVRLYLQNGNMPLATNELASILQVTTRDRIMMNHFRLWECDLPVFVLEMFGYHNIFNGERNLKLDLMDQDHARYMIMMVGCVFIFNVLISHLVLCCRCIWLEDRYAQDIGHMI